MQHVQGYTGSHWTLPSGDYSLRITLAAARATANKTTMYYLPTLMAISGYLFKVVVMALAGEVTRELSPIRSWSNNNYEI
jgi:hypothetical protein